MTLPALQSVSTHHGDVAFREAGTGPALVLLHGLGGSSETWEYQYTAFSDRFRVIAWDMPGYGGSAPLPDGTPDVNDYAAVLAEMLGALDIGHAHIVGQSVAALIGAAYVATWPDQTLSYTFGHGLTGLGRLPPETRAKTKVARLKVFDELGPAGFAEQRGGKILGPGTPPAMADRAVDIMARVPTGAYHQATEMMAEADFYSLAPAIVAPALVLCGGADPVAPEAECRAAAEALPNASFRLLDEMGHYSCMENPALFNEALGEFLDRATAKE